MKKHGIRITLTQDNPMRLSHLLGEDWESVHWYDSEAKRDTALQDMSRRLPNYRRGDDLAQVFTKIEQKL
jgi:hypothetical protein